MFVDSLGKCYQLLQQILKPWSGDAASITLLDQSTPSRAQVMMLNAVMRDLVCMNFTVKQAQIAWRKVCIEFEKRIR